MKTRRRIVCAFMMAVMGLAPLAKAQEVEPTWESINQRGYPEWFKDAKLGIFVHWGLYSVPAWAGPEGYGEWYYKGLMSGDSGRIEVMKHYGGDYASLRDHWHATNWAPESWARLFKESGAKYVLLVTKHHDGYCLWDYPNTALENWNSVVSGPRRNIVSGLTEAVRAEGLQMGFYYSLTEWSNPIHTWTVHPHGNISKYVDSYMIPQFKDLITKYKPTVLFTDGEWDNTAEQFKARELISWYYNTVGKDAIVNNRWGAGHQHGYKTPEYSGGIIDTVTPWAECRGIGRSFGVNHNERLENFMSSEELISHFAQLVAAGGGLTLNVGPEADGTIPFIQQERLKDLGRWLEVNGEAIYGSRPWIRSYDTRKYTVERTDSVLRFNWVRNAPEKGLTVDSFDVVWKFTITPEVTDQYTFTMHADDSATLLFEGKPVLTAQKDTVTYQLHLAARKEYHFEIHYRENDLEARMQLFWESNNMSKRAVKADNGFEGVYTCDKPYVCYTTQGNTLYAIATEWPGEESEFNLIVPCRESPSAGTKISLLGCEKPIHWEYNKKKKAIVIKTDNLDYHDISKYPAGGWTFKIDSAKPLY